MAQAQPTDRQLISFGKALQKELGTRPAVPADQAALVQGAAYRQHISRGDWSGLHAAATQDRASTDRQVGSATSYQRRMNRLTERAESVTRPGLAAQGGQPIRIDKVKGWRAAAGQAREDLVKQGVPMAFARRTITKIGHQELSLESLADRARSLSKDRGQQLNQAFRLYLRAQAGAALAEVFAQLGGAPVGTAARSRAKEPDYLALEQAVHAALLAGQDATGPATALQAAGDKALPTAAARLRRAKPGSESSLDATVAVKSALEAALLGRFLLWRLGWTVPGLTGPVASASEHAFRAERAEGPSLVAARSATAGLGGTLTDLRYAEDASHLVLDDGIRVVVPFVDVRFFGCVPGTYVQVTSATREADGSYSVHFVDPAPTGSDWRETLRQQLRPSFLADPFGLGLRWSWLPGSADSARFLTLGLWFS